MPEFGNFLSGAAGGAGVGMMFGGIGAPVGALVGGLASLFGSSAEEKRKARLEDQMKFINGLRSASLSRGFTEIGKDVQRNISSARQAATRRAMALGRGGDAETLIAPAEGRALESGGRAITDFMLGTQKQFDSAALSAQSEFAGSPIEPSTGEYLLTVGKGVAQYAQNQDYIKALRGFGAQGE